jgi:hypothetical protein
MRPSLSSGVRAGALVLAGVLLLAACSGGGRGAAGGTRPSAGTRAGGGPVPSPLVNPNDLLPGGPPPDGIPPIDHPRFLAIAEVHFLTPQEPVIAVELNGQAKAYPLRILVWHEIVNDRIGGVPVTVTYCPLCNTGIAFRRPVIGGRLLDFGTSGKLYHSNLVMYDRQTNSLWPQALGRAVVGPLTGTTLQLVATQILSWEDWKVAYPDGLVLSERTGFARQYGTNPYAGYDTSGFPFLYDGTNVDGRLPPLARVLGVVTNGALEAFPYSVLQGRAAGGLTAVNTDVGGEPIVVLWKSGTVSALDQTSIPDSRDVGAAAAFGRTLGGRTLTFRVGSAGFVDEQTRSGWDINGRAISGPLAGKQLPRVIALDSFWFDWWAFHPTTEVFGS